MFTENLKFHRSNRGYSQEKLAEVADVSLRTIQRLESGDTEPRGDTVTRIAQALDVAPGELLQCEKKKDTSYQKGLQISAFSFLLFPLLGVLLPFILWITKRDQIEGVDYSGKEIINFQITWNLALFSGLLCYLIWVRYSFSYVTEVSLSISQAYMILFYSIVGVLYLYNLAITALNYFRVRNNLPVWFKPSLRLLK